ncbi:hypothetical protein [Streptosporangium sandarakinum]|uniref:hypothetical protein n=1 Tax=Streptosporangium sandarakinum TaxID=1260955 RepID=UPI003723DF43
MRVTGLPFPPRQDSSTVSGDLSASGPLAAPIVHTEDDTPGRAAVRRLRQAKGWT